MDVEERALPPVPAKQLPHPRQTDVSGRWGFHGSALLTDLHIDVPRPRAGLATLLDQPAFRKDRIPPIPAGARFLGVVSLDLSTAHDSILELVRFVGRDVYGAVVEGERALREATGLRVREDALAHLGPTWLCFIPPREPANGDSQLPAFPVLLGDLKDAAAFGKALDTIAAWFNRSMREAEAARGPQREPILQLRPLPGGDRGYVLTAPPGLSALQVGSPIRKRCDPTCSPACARPRLTTAASG